MLVAIVFSFLVLSAGYAALRMLGLAKGATALGMMPAAGLAVTAIAATWSGLLRAPPPIPGVLVVACSVYGCALVVRDRDSLRAAVLGFVHQHRAAAGFLAAAAVIPAFIA